MKKKVELSNLDTEENRCDHCNRTFIRSGTLLKHLCEQKRRWQESSKPANRIAYGAWTKFYSTFQPSRKRREYKDFINSPYYSAFVKWGNYCVDIKAVNVDAYVDYLLKNNTPIDTWDSDRVYTKYLIDYLRTENALDAVKRSIDTMLDIAQNENIQLQDVFRVSNYNKLCHLVTTGHISPWVLYNTKTGKEFLFNINQDQTQLIFDYIDPERWNIKFRRESENVKEVVELLRTINVQL